MLEMLQNWQSALESSNTVIRVVFLDFSKAFALINYNILSSEYIGVRSALLPRLCDRS